MNRPMKLWYAYSWELWGRCWRGRRCFYRHRHYGAYVWARTMKEARRVFGENMRPEGYGISVRRARDDEAALPVLNRKEDV